MAIISIGICIGENLLLGIGNGSVGTLLYLWNPTTKETVKQEFSTNITS